MLGIKGINYKFCRIIPNSWYPVHLPNPISIMVAYSSIGQMQLGNAAKGVLCHMVSDNINTSIFCTLSSYRYSRQAGRLAGRQNIGGFQFLKFSTG